MHAALVSAGLFEDEATAMLATWRQAYLTSQVFVCSSSSREAWTDRHLPLTISVPAKIERVMMARTELVSPEQRACWLASSLSIRPRLDRAGPPGAGYARLVAGRSDFGDLGVTIPADFQAYLDLGRFRSVLLVREFNRCGARTCRPSSTSTSCDRQSSPPINR